MTDAPDARPARAERRGRTQPRQAITSAVGREASAGLLCLVVLGAITLWALGAVVPVLVAQYVWPLLLLSAVGYFLAFEGGLLRLAGPRFPVLVVLVAIVGIALPYLAWPARAAELAADALAWPALTAGLVAPAVAVAAHLAVRVAGWGDGHGPARLTTARPPSVLIVFGLVLALGFAVLNALHGDDVPGLSNQGVLALAGRALAGVATGLLLLRYADRIDGTAWLRRPVVLLPVTAVLAVLLVALFRFYGAALTDRAALAATGGVAVLFLILRTPVAGVVGLAALIALMPRLPVLLDLAYSPEAGPLAGLVPPLLAVVLVAAVLLDQRADLLSGVLARGRRLDRLRARLERYGAGQLLYADLTQKRISLHELTTGRQPTISFSRFFRHARSSEILDLLEALHNDPAPEAERGFPVHISVDPFAGTEAEQGPIRPVELHVIEQFSQQAWLGLVDVSLKTELEERANRADRALGEALVREERLLSVAAHELRTPLSVLLMLSEELDAGTPWDEVAPNFRKSLDRMTSLLDDLRVRNSKDEVHMMQTTFTLREMALHLQEIFTGSAQANGVALLLGISQQGDTLIISDYGRVFIALSKLIHNAIIHSHGSEVTISVFLTRQTEGKAIVTWQVSDNGRGISPERYKTVFRPFDTDGFGQDGERPGLGLYTARKAVQAMGGDLSLRRTSDIGAVPRRLPPFSTASAKAEIANAKSYSGATFVLKHPARLAERVKHETLEQLPVTETQAKYSDKTVLLIEDNQIVGEITVARLRRLFGKTIWSQDGEDALTAYTANKPDLLLVDQLLPGMLGSELVRHVRETDRHLPIVGITASTLGSEVAELEASGANYALEKPLSVQQLQKIAEEFFGARNDEGQGAS